MRTPAQWFSYQIGEYRKQKQFADFAAMSRRAQQDDQAFEAGAKANLGSLRRELNVLEHRRNLSKSRNTAIERVGAGMEFDDIFEPPDGYDNKGEGIGGFLGRLFNGRLFRSSRDAQREQSKYILTEAEISDEELEKIETLGKNIKHVEDSFKAMRDRQENQAGNLEIIKTKLNKHSKMTGRPILELPNNQIGELAAQLMPEEGNLSDDDPNLNTHMDVYRTFAKLANGNVSPENNEKLCEYLKLAVDRINGLPYPMEVKGNNGYNYDVIEQNAKTLQLAYHAVGPIMDLAASRPEIGAELFETADKAYDFELRGHYLATQYANVRKELFAQYSITSDKDLLNRYVCEKIETPQRIAKTSDLVDVWTREHAAQTEKFSSLVREEAARKLELKVLEPINAENIYVAQKTQNRDMDEDLRDFLAEDDEPEVEAVSFAKLSKDAMKGDKKNANPEKPYNYYSGRKPAEAKEEEQDILFKR